MPSPLSRLSRTYERSYKASPSLTLAITNGCLKCLGDFLAQILPCLLDGHIFSFDVHRSIRFLAFGLMHGPCVGKWHEFLENRIPLTLSTTSRSLTQPGTHSTFSQLEAEKATLSPQSMSHKTTSQHTIRNRTSSLSDDPGHLRQFMSADVPNIILRPSRRRRMLGVGKRLVLDQLVMAPLFVFVFISFTGFLEGLSISEIQARLDDLYWHILTANWKIWPIIQIINFNFMPLQYRVPWQSSCGIVWTVFLSLSTHTQSHNTVLSAVGASAASAAVSRTASELLPKTSSINDDESPLMMAYSLRRIGLSKLKKIQEAVARHDPAVA